MGKRLIKRQPSQKQRSQKKPKFNWRKIGRFLLFISLLLSALWLGLFIWYQIGSGSASVLRKIMAGTLIVSIIGLLTAITNLSRNHYSHSSFKKRNKLIGLYALVWSAGLITFFSLSPSSDRDWQPEVAQMFNYERSADNPDIITLHNVRNFDWHSNVTPADVISQQDEASSEDTPLRFETNSQMQQQNTEGDSMIPPTPRWESRQIDLSKLKGMDILNSYWMGPKIGHTLVTFRFEDDRPIALSFEVRKEKGESFSTLGGFFRKYELSLIASEERDMIYTRSNWRGEQGYLLPVEGFTPPQVRELFEHYLNYADTLQERPEWYNTLINNCTNLIFKMAREVDSERFPLDYRIWLTGYVPDYLYDNRVLPKSKAGRDSEVCDIQTWYEQAYINPKTVDFSEQDNISMTAYSKLIRRDLPTPDLD